MNPYHHEFWHLLRSRALIAVVIVSLLAGLVEYDAINSATTGVTEAGFWFQEGDTFHIELWSLDVAGQPVANAQVGVNIVEFIGGNDTAAPPQAVFSGSQSSDLQGRVEFVAPDLLRDNTSYLVSIILRSPHLIASVQFPISNRTSDLPVPLYTPFLAVTQGFYSAYPRAAVVWGGRGGAPPAGETVTGCDVPNNYNSLGPSSANCTGSPYAFDMGPLTGYVTFLPLPPPLPQGNSTTYWNQILEVVNSNGSLATTDVYTAYCTLGTCSAPSSQGPGLLNLFASELGLVLPLMAVIASYWAYAGPRLTGTQDSVLARPVTRRGLFLVRFGAIAIALATAFVGEVLLFDAEVGGILHEPLPGGDIAALAGGLAVSAIAAIGLVFLLAHVLRSATAVLGIGIGFVLATSIFWLLLVASAWLVIGSPADAGGFSTFALHSQFLASSQYPSLVAGAQTGLSSVAGFDEYGRAGVTGWDVAVAGVAWMTVPLFFAYRLAVSRD